MTKKQKEQERLDMLKRAKDQEKLDNETKEIAKKIETILNEYSYALQPYIHTEVNAGAIQALVGKVRLVKVRKEEVRDGDVKA